MCVWNNGAMTFEERWSRIRAALMKHADDLAYDAGMAGKMSDNGAEALRRNVKMFDAGLARNIPAEWERITAPLLDPEWADYQRLRSKFEHR